MQTRRPSGRPASKGENLRLPREDREEVMVWGGPL